MKPTNTVYVGGPPLDPHECDLECANCGYEYDRWELEFTGGKCPSCKHNPTTDPDLGKTMSEWTKVEDGLPEECQKVIVWVDRYNYYPDYMDVSHRQDGAWTKHDGAYQRISHWMPLPERPKK